MKNRRNYYRLLQVQPDAPLEVIKASYRTLMQKLKHHPDLGGKHSDAALLNEAYAVLCDPDKRAEYDRALRRTDAGKGQAARRGRSRKRETRSERHASGPQPVCAFCKAAHEASARIDDLADCPVCHSPLQRATHLHLAGSDRRTLTRVSQAADITFFREWPPQTHYRAAVRDLSPKGMQFVSTHSLNVGSIIKLESESVLAVARVISCREEPNGEYSTGVEFLTLRLASRRGTFISASA